MALAETLAGLAREGVRFAAIEASSHGLDQFRLDGVRLAAAGFTNLTRDHLDYHGTMAAYRAAKLRLFATLLPRGAPAVASTRWTPRRWRPCALASAAAWICARWARTATRSACWRAVPHPGGQHLELLASGAPAVDLPLPGRFQADNALLAAGLALALGVTDAMARLPR